MEGAEWWWWMAGGGGPLTESIWWVTSSLTFFPPPSTLPLSPLPLPIAELDSELTGFWSGSIWIRMRQDPRSGLEFSSEF